MKLRANPKRTAKALNTPGSKKTPTPTVATLARTRQAASTDVSKTPTAPKNATPANKNAKTKGPKTSNAGNTKSKAKDIATDSAEVAKKELQRQVAGSKVAKNETEETVKATSSTITAATDPAPTISLKEDDVKIKEQKGKTTVKEAKSKDTKPEESQEKDHVEEEELEENKTENTKLDVVEVDMIVNQTDENEAVETLKPSELSESIQHHDHNESQSEAPVDLEISLMDVNDSILSSDVIVSTDTCFEESSSIPNDENELDFKQVSPVPHTTRRRERSTAAQKRKLSEETPKPSGGKRKSKAAKVAQSAETPELKNSNDKDERSFERFYTKVKDTSVVSERWSFGGVLWDPTKKMKVMAASEVDVTSNGNMRLRRCVQVFENMTVRIMVEGADMTSNYSTTGLVKNANEVSQLIHKVATSKICSGIKNFGATDKVYFPHCVLRGESYFAPECPIVIDHGVVGPLCQHCNRLRNMIHRRNVKETNLLYSKFSRAPVKNIRSGFGKQLYSMLTDMIEASSVDAKKERKKLRRMIPANAKEYPFRFDTPAQLQQFIKGDASGSITLSSLPHNALVTPSSVASSEYIRIAKPYIGGPEMMTFNVVSGQRGSYKVSREGTQLSAVQGSSGSFAGAMLTPGEMHMVEQLVLQEGHDVGNVIIQNSGDFTLAEGQEYELIGEADPNNPIQVLEVLKEDNEVNNTIEIIEVDDQTLAQLTSQNLGNFIIQEPNSDFEVQEIDANDPNFRHLVKALNPGTVMYQS